ncbi:spore-associated protein A [Streptomyces coacervatus]|uniref:Spore-associated protein A n=1 Tax=Streptomyces coacervatus TaxID=647381 RepID=A0ABP7IK28_9ACTN|nr:spore-associated protein A [Streptomyces coacervatus]MDF2273060.1 spore-associated protein A [Streptomyces coacervatus]
MNKLSRRATTAAALTVLALGGTVAATAPASAATTRAAAASYNGACGTGYKVIDSTPVGNSGKVFLTWNESTGKNCAVTIRNTTGAKIYMSVELNALVGHETTPVRDAGEYKSYAGPVYVEARGHCIEWYGVIGNASGGDSGHCG